ncbi:DUF7384 family protein [Halomarina litorea]|uniref:DUF7384 family protein n=1 Tax=Halomarina litorea TaxID=2961595 RepID=UPI0020C53932|nr:hypothetical protein [Halomarina sp. BCD28]
MRDESDDREYGADERFGRVVADADVLAADLLVGGGAREALDVVRSHSWVTLVASDPLLDDAAAVVRSLADAGLARDWRERCAALCELVDHPPGDHPALATAFRGEAVHVLSFDESLRSAKAGASIRERVETSVKHPDAFARLFDPDDAHEVVVGGPYPGPDRDPRA